MRCLVFFFSLTLWGCFSKNVGTLQFGVRFEWWPSLNIAFSLGVDGISIFFLLLSTLLVPLCLLASWRNVKFDLKEFLVTSLALDFLLIGVFCVTDLLFFYLLFESVLIPMYFIIGVWGSRERKVLAAYYFFLYTLLGSALMLVSIAYIFWQARTTEYNLLATFSFSKLEQAFLWVTFFLAFASKVPMVPVHLWLPEAHVEAPTAGSVLLAGVLLKLGTYGFLRFSLPLFPYASFYYAPVVGTFAVIGVVLASFTAIRQTDFKRVIAYTSIAHMNLVVLGVFSFNSIGIEGAILQSLSHGFVASALFLLVGVLYDRYKTRLIYYYGGLATAMPVFIVVFLVFTMANLAFPGTSSFVGEFLILTGTFTANRTISVIGATGVVTSGVYSLWLFNRVAYGNLKNHYTKKFADLNARELMLLLPLLSGTVLVGVCPNFFLTTTHMSVNHLLETMHT